MALLTAFQKIDLSQLSLEIGEDWYLPAAAVQQGLETLCAHLNQVKGDAILRYEMV